MVTSLATYLRNHEAAAAAGQQLFERVARSHRDRDHGEELRQLAVAVADDLDLLRRLMTDLGIDHAPVRAGLLRITERLARLKPNGTLMRRSPLTDLIEVEALLDAVHAKAAGWDALRAADVGEDQRLGTEQRVSHLAERADDQLDSLRRIHLAVAAESLSHPPAQNRGTI